MQGIKQDFYTSQGKRLIKDFDKLMHQVQGPIITRYGEKQAAEMIAGARFEFQELLPALPYVGGEQPFTQFVIASGWFLAFYRAMQAHGASVGETGELAFLLSQTYLQRVPGFARRLLGYMSFTPRYLARLRERALLSQTHPYPGGYIYSYVEGDGMHFDYGVDYQQCATLTLFRENGAAELTPYLCACDHLYSKLLGWGLTRTTTLAEGGKVCDFRFKKGGPTRIHSTVLRLE